MQQVHEQEYITLVEIKPTTETPRHGERQQHLPRINADDRGFKKN
ncbi:MAG TPA: hypothetical protein VGK22_13250 [Candidatus Angelobacter sp.]|jgi:hypothetical protein